ncbi:MAG: glycosyltransferase family 39 protein [Opitutaceae bacterium]
MFPVSFFRSAWSIISRRWQWLCWLAFGLGLLWLAGRFGLVAGGSDSSGYLNSAKLFAEGSLEMRVRIPAELASDANILHFTPLGFWPSSRTGFLSPTYPSGLPLQLALARVLLGGELGQSLLLIGLAGAVPLLCAWCARELGLSAGLAWTGASIIATSPIFLFCAQQPLSDGPATTWCLLAAASALAANRTRRAAWGLVCGAAFSIAVLVRPSNALLLPALLLLLGHWKGIVATGLGGLPGACWFGFYNQFLYGHALRTGYADIRSAFEMKWILPSLHLYAEWIPRMLSWMVVVLPLAALISVRSRWRLVAGLGLWWLIFAGFYSTFAVTHEVWWCLRFLLPCFPALLLAALLGLENLVQLTPSRIRDRARTGLIAGLGIVAVTSGVLWTRALHVAGTGKLDLHYRDAGNWVREHLPENAVVSCMAASGTLHYYASVATLRYDGLSTKEYEGYAKRLRQANRPLYALLFPFEREQANGVHGTDQWRKVREFGGMTLWKLDAAP